MRKRFLLCSVLVVAVFLTTSREALACADPATPWYYGGNCYATLGEAEAALRGTDIDTGLHQDWRVYFEFKQAIENVRQYHLQPRPHLPNPAWRTSLNRDYQNWGWVNIQSPHFPTYEQAEAWLAQYAGVASLRGPGYEPAYFNLVYRGSVGTSPFLRRVYSDASLDVVPGVFDPAEAEWRYCYEFAAGVEGGRIGRTAHSLYRPDAAGSPSVLHIFVNRCLVNGTLWHINVANATAISQVSASPCMAPYESDGTQCVSDLEEVITYGPLLALTPSPSLRECPLPTNRSPVDESNPCSPVDGTKTQVEVDYASSAEGVLEFARYYSSKGAYKTDADFAPGWRHTYSRRIDEAPDVRPTLSFTTASDRSGFHPTPATACTAGWTEIKDTVWGGDLSAATATFAGSNVCKIEQGGSVVAYFPVRSLIGPSPFTPAANIKTVSRPNGNVETFEYDGNAWVNHLNPAVKLEEIGSTWVYTDANEMQEVFDAAGKLLRIEDRNGLATTMEYETGGAAKGKLRRVYGPFGHVLNILNDNQTGLLDSVYTVGAERTYFRYTGERLTSSYRTAHGEQHYLYEKPTLPDHLTGIVDYNGDRYVTWDYDASGRAILSERAGGKGRVEFTYNVDDSTTLTLGNGASRVYHYTAGQGRRKLANITGDVCGTCGAGGVKSRTYDSNGFVREVEDWNGNRTETIRNARGLVETLVEAKGSPAERTTTTTWHPTWRLPTQRVSPKNTTDYTYDANGNLETLAVTAGSDTRAWNFTYNASGQPLTIDGSRTDVADVTTITYHNCTTGNKCGQVASVTNALGHTTTYDDYDPMGRLKQSTDPNGMKTYYRYNTQGLVDRVTFDPISGNNLYIWLTYDDIGQLTEFADSNGRIVDYAYDAAHSLRSMTHRFGHRTDYDYDAMGNLKDEDVYDNQGVLRRAVDYAYDINSRLDSLTSGGFTSDLTMDPVGNLTAVTDPGLATTQHSYDALNRLKQTTDALSGVIGYAYDDHDNLTTVTAANSAQTTYVYDNLDNLTQEISPDRGTTTYTHDDAGNVATRQDARGIVTTYSYDALNRLVSETTPGGSSSYTYDVGANAIGRLTSVADPSGQTSWTYDTHGRIASKTQTIGGVSLTVQYDYDQWGRFDEQTLPSGKQLFITNSAELPVGIKVGSVTVLSGAKYEPFGPVRSWTWGDATVSTRSFDMRGLQTSHSLAADTRTLGYDNVGQIVTLDDARHDLDFDYDALGRLFDFDALGLAPLASQDFSYDANGNRLSFTEGTSYPYTVTPNSNRVATVAGPVPKTYSYDAAGNIINDGTTAYTYDDRGRLVTAGTASYTYNGLGQRVKKDNGTVTLFVYDEAGNLIGEYDAAGHPIREHVWFAGAPVAVIVGSDVHYVHTDHLGTPRAITDAGTVIWRWESDPFGSTAADEDPDGDLTSFTYNLRFPGQYYDSESGLHYNYFRTYDPSTGRYLESDPIGLDGGLNTYSYGLQNPLTYADPSGQAPIVPAVIAFCKLNPYACAAAAAGIYYAADQAVRGVHGAISNIHIGPWPGSTTNPDAETAGEEAADEILEEEEGCPIDGSDMQKCKEMIRRCRQKCQNRSSPGTGNYSEWLGRCVNRCTSQLGCSNTVLF